MTPKERATESQKNIGKTYNLMELKRKAIYLVSEIIDSMPLRPVTNPVGSHGENINNSNKYWADVKQALENL